MKKVKPILSMMIAFLLLFSRIPVYAVTLPSQTVTEGATTAIVVMEFRNLKSVDGEFSITSSDNKTRAVIQYVKLGENKDNAIRMISGDKLYMVSSDNNPVDTEVVVGLSFSGDGTYHLNFTGDGTNNQNKYEPYNLTKDIMVGTADVDPGDDPVPEVPDTDTTEETETTTEQTPETTTEEQNQTTTVQSTTTEEEGADTSYLEAILAEVMAIMAVNEVLKTQEELMKQVKEATALLNSNDQEAVDEAAGELKETLDDIKEEEEEKTTESDKIDDKNDEEKKDSANDSRDKKTINPKILILIAVFVLAFAAVTGYLLWQKKFKKMPDFDGAPDVEYNIEDDD